MQVFFCKITEKFLKKRENGTGAVKLLAFLYKSVMRISDLTKFGSRIRTVIYSLSIIVSRRFCRMLLYTYKFDKRCIVSVLKPNPHQTVISQNYFLSPIALFILIWYNKRQSFDTIQEVIQWILYHIPA